MDNYEHDDGGAFLGINHNGAWEAGVDGALPGAATWASPVAGTSCYQVYWEDEATDMGYVVPLGVDVELDDGTLCADCVQILDWNPLAPEALEYKYFAPGVGLVKEEVVRGEEVVELIGIELE